MFLLWIFNENCLNTHFLSWKVNWDSIENCWFEDPNYNKAATILWIIDAISRLDPWFYGVAHQECRKWTYEKDYTLTHTWYTFRNSSWLHSKVDLNKLARSEREAVIIDPAFVHWSSSGNCSFRRFLFVCCHNFLRKIARNTSLIMYVGFHGCACRWWLVFLIFFGLGTRFWLPPVAIRNNCQFIIPRSNYNVFFAPRVWQFICFVLIPFLRIGCGSCWKFILCLKGASFEEFFLIGLFLLVLTSFVPACMICL